MNSIYVITSINVDMVAHVRAFPKAGETVLGYNFSRHYGGKGANQAMTIRRLGLPVIVVGKIGKDMHGNEYKSHFEENQIDTRYIFQSPEQPTGMAMINVDENGENTIIVISGANGELTGVDIEKTKDILSESKIVISQFEVPVEASFKAFKMVKESENGGEVITIFNPAPARPIPGEMWKYIDVIIPNEGELSQIVDRKLTTIEEIKQASCELLVKGVKYVLVTMGENGSMLTSSSDSYIIPPIKVNAVDTTAAGDSFIGGLAAALSQKEIYDDATILECAGFAAKVAAVVVQREGAQTSLPTMQEVMNASL
ncbi:MAG: ribokinase [Anaerocolumna sp.]